MFVGIRISRVVLDSGDSFSLVLRRRLLRQLDC